MEQAVNGHGEACAPFSSRNVPDGCCGERDRSGSLHDELHVRALHCTGDAVSLLNAAGEHQCHNEAFSNMFGWTLEEIRAGGGVRLLYSDAQVCEAIRSALRGGGSWFGETTMLARDGRDVPVRVRADSILDEKGGVVGGICIHGDVSAARQAAEELCAAKEAAEEASRAKSQFLANMSHEIRTPLNGILGLAELALDTPANEEQAGFLRALQDSAESLRVVINDILDFSRIEAGRLEIDRIEFALHDCLRSVMQLFAPQAQGKGLLLLLDVAHDVPDRLVGDPSRLRQILSNLLSNALKFTEQGRVVVRVHLLSRMEHDVFLHFEVSDTGVGIPAEGKQRVFEAFEQADTSTTRRFGGTGLGLAIVTRLVELMHGQVCLDSEVGKGTSFHFTVRMEVASDRDRPERLGGVSAELNGLKTLVVDNDASSREFLLRAAKSWGMNAQGQAVAAEALLSLRRGGQAGDPYDVVLLDYNTPGQDGFGLLTKARACADLSDVVVVVMSSNGRQGDAHRCKSLGAAAYLSKPFTRDELRDVLLAAVNARQLSSQGRGLVTRHSLREYRSLRILLAEDRPINQELTRAMLTKRGHEIVVAGDGQQAVEAVVEGRFDAVLMDVHMPVMSGLEATRAIRAQWPQDRPRLPIIAMTANSMAGDRQECFEAGMDAYVAKPVRRQELIDTVENVVARLANPFSLDGAAASADAMPGSEERFDWNALLKHTEGDEALARQLAEMFLADGPAMLHRVQRALQDEDFRVLVDSAHSLKGSAGVLGAANVCRAAAEVERLGREQALAELRPVFETARVELWRLVAALNAEFKESDHARSRCRA